MKREQLKTIELENNLGKDVNGIVHRVPWEAYDVEEVDSLLDEMEARIKELEAEAKKWKNDAANCCALLHLVRKGKNPSSTDMIAEADRLEKLESENARLKSIVDDEEYKHGISGLAQRNAELRDENARLKAQVPKWHDPTKLLYTEDGADYYDLPTRSDTYCVLFHTEDEERRLIRSACYYFADDDGNSRFGEWEFDGVEKWCELPPPPTTEESEKEN